MREPPRHSDISGHNPNTLRIAPPAHPAYAHVLLTAGLLAGAVALGSCQLQAGTNRPTTTAREKTAAQGNLNAPLVAPTEFPAGCVPIPKRNGPVSLEPGTPPAQIGVPYCFLINTHCGIDFANDIDGAFWTVAPRRSEGDAPNLLDNQDQGAYYGTVTLLDHRRARFTTTGGSIDFERSPKQRLEGFCR
jgi:hypothetical protein